MAKSINLRHGANWMMKASTKLARLAAELYKRRDDGVIVPFVVVEVEGWKPEANDCHGNARHYVLSMLVRGEPDCKVAHGWLYFERSRRGCPTFIPHSMVETAEGLIDITPSNAVRRYPFVRDHSPPGEFLRLIERHGIIHLDFVGG